MTKFTIVIPLYPNVTQLDFTGPHQVLGRAPDTEIVVASMGGVDMTCDGLTFTGLADLARIERCDMICVPGGLGTAEAMLDEAFIREVRRLGAGAKYVTSVCTGSLILAAAGFLSGKRAACHWASRDLLKHFGAIVDEGRVVRDGATITGGGVTAGIDFAFVVLAELAGEDYAKAIQLSLEYAPAPPFNSGRPELASPEILQQVTARYAALANTRLASAAEAAARLQPA
jgi:cyclohexyl-isocyanide hydratase